MPPASLSDGASSPLKSIHLSYDISNSEESARALVVALDPEWESSPGPIEFVRFKDGITNTLFKAIKKRPGHDAHAIDKEAVLLRAYGNGTAVLIDRDREAQSHSLLARHGLAPPLLARFENGLLYRFIEGEPCSPDDLQRKDVWPAIAGLLGRWHAIIPTQETTSGSSDNDHRQFDVVKKLVPSTPLPHLWSVMQKWINALPSKTPEEKTRNEGLQAALVETAATMSSVPGLSDGAYVMSHCDLLSGNVIIRPGKTHSQLSGHEIANISFIDYEYTTPAPAAFDLANHFAEYVGFDCDMSKIPGPTQRRAFIREYAAEYRRNTSTTCRNGDRANSYGGTNGVHAHVEKPRPTLEDDVERLMQEVDQFRGLPGLYWGIWALIQATISSIDFDYASYADIRLGEYWAWKDQQDETKRKSGVELCLREQRWAQDEA